MINDRNVLNKGIYIPNIEACWLYKFNQEDGNYIVKDEYLDKLLNGKLDYSHELVLNDKLINNIEIKKMNDEKLYTLDVVNVKFTKKYENKNKEKTTKELRDWCYEEGFVFNNKLMSNWKRSSGKARIGQNLFILNSIQNECLDWARMGLKFKGKVDIGSIRAYESLPLSSIIGIIKIDPKGILVINDYESIFDWKMSKTWLDKGELKTKTDVMKECNSIWDGQGLLSNKIFDTTEFLKGKGVALLRNRYMKCAGFCCYIEKFFRKYCEDKGYDYETYEIEDMYHNKIKVKDILLITTPSAIKIKKYNNDEKIKEEGYNGDGGWLQYWKNNCGNIFGVCKTEKPSHHCIKDKEGNIITYRNVLSYQMVNTIPFEKDELKKLVKPEIEYIEKLKKDSNFFLQEINQLGNDYIVDEEDTFLNDNDIEFGNNMDVIQAFIELYKRNSQFANTQVFKDYRRNFINAYIRKLRQGKIRIEGADYCVACGNPYEMLKATVGEFYGESLTLKDNELYCSRFVDGEDVIGFRNPSVNVGNIGVQINKFSKEIHEYMNDTENIVYLNSIEYPILSTYQGEDFDIDSNLLINHPIIVAACKRIDKNITAIPVNAVENTGKNNRELTAKNMSDVDHIISQNFIGSTINLSQEINSIMNHAKYNELLDEFQLSKIYDMTSKLSSISCCEIDKAKKQFEDLNVPKELDKMKIGMELVDNTKIIKINKCINSLKEDLKIKYKEVNQYRKNKRKLYSNQRKKIENILRINNNKQLTDEEINQFNKEITELNTQFLNIDKNEKSKRKLINKKIKSIKKILTENKIEKLTNEKVEELKQELNIINELINYINIQKQEEIDIIKYNINKKNKELKQCDCRRIKPYFFKFVGDNEAKKQRKAINKKHKKNLKKKIIEQFAKDNGLKVNDVYMKDEKLLKLLNQSDSLEQKWEEIIYRKIDTPMDWLQDELDTIKNNKNNKANKTIQVVQLLNKNTNKINKDIVDYIVNSIKYLYIKIKSYRLNHDLSSKEKLEKIKYEKERVINEIIKYMKLNKADLYGVLKECLNSVKNNGKLNKKSGIESISLEILFMAYGDKLLDMFQ